MSRIIEVEKPFAAPSFLFVILQHKRKRDDHEPLVVFCKQVFQSKTIGNFSGKEQPADRKVEEGKRETFFHGVIDSDPSQNP